MAEEVKKKAVKNKTKKKIMCGAAVLLLLILAAVYTVFARPDAEEEIIVYKEETAAYGDLVQGIMESGSVVLQTESQTYDIVLEEDEEDDGEEDEDEEETHHLKVENVYVKQGQRIKKGDPVLKVTEQSIRSVRRFLTSEAADAQITLERLKNEYEAEQTAAAGTYQENVTDSVWAEPQYMIDLVEIDLEIAALTDSVAVLEQEILQIETDLEDGWDEYADLKEEYETYERRYQEWDKDNLYTYIPLRTEYLDAKDRYETETENRLDKRQEMADKQEEIRNIQEEIARLQGKTERRQMEARQAYDSAILNGSMASDVYAYSLQSLEREIETAQEELEDLNEKLTDFNAFAGEDGIVCAENDGMITMVYYEAGDTLQEESRLITYVMEDSYVLSVDVSEEDIPWVHVGDEVTIVFTAYPDDVYFGRVEEIMTSETSEGTVMVSYPVTVRVEGDTSKLYGGMTGDVTFVTEQVSQAVYVSRKAVTTQDGKTYVWIKDKNGEMIRREVETGFTDGVYIQIVSGLSEGDTVYIESRISADAAAETENQEEKERRENHGNPEEGKS